MTLTNIHESYEVNKTYKNKGLCHCDFDFSFEKR